MKPEQELTAIISVVRHGEKNEQGQLTEIGVRQAALKGVKTIDLQGDVILLHSSSERVRDTILSMARHLHIKNEAEIEQLLEQEPSFQHYVSHYLHYLYDPHQKGELFGHWDDVKGDREAENAQVERFLSQKATSSEPEIYPSPESMARRLARVIATEIDFATITTPDVKTNFINGTHEPVLMSFLYYFLQDYQPTDPQFVKTLHGSVDYAEGFDIYVFQGASDDNKVMFRFRTFQQEIDQHKLKEFCKG